MKIASLLTQYLYTNQRLDLPGIGTFFLDPSATAIPENNKQRSTILEGISFKSNPSVKESPELIAFISAQSGKMKALASSDLESHLQLALQFLNIGKPFTFEGVGTLTKVKQGEFELIPVAISTEKLRDLGYSRETPGKSNKEEHSGKKYESFLSEPRPKEGLRKPVIALFILAGLGLAIWGGYAISKKARPVSETEITGTALLPSAATEDSLRKLREDSIAAREKLAWDEKNYRYVLEVAKRQRAFKRYNQLRTNLWEVKMETTDSVQYKLVLELPALNSDTTRVLDSLTAMLGRKVYIDHQN